MSVRVCGDCARETVVMLEMRPGRDKQPWWLCSGCWIASTKPEPKAFITKGRR